jgi:hypothetical protein
MRVELAGDWLGRPICGSVKHRGRPAAPLQQRFERLIAGDAARLQCQAARSSCESPRL